MDGNRDLYFMDHSSYFELELVLSPFQGQVHTYAYDTERREFFGIAFHAGNDGKRNHTFQRGICFPADFRWDCYGKNNAYARSFLGIRTHVIAPWSALEYDSCHGAKNDGNNGR